MITKEELSSLITDGEALQNGYTHRAGFAFAPLTKKNVFDALVVKEDAAEECVKLINELRLDSSVFITNNAGIIKQCPTLKHFTIYLNPENKSFPRYGEIRMTQGVRNFSLDEVGINELYTGGKSPLLFQKLKTLKRLNMCGHDDKSDDRKDDIKTIEDFDLPDLLKLSIIQCGITSLAGIENCKKLQWLSLDYMRSLTDISALSALAPTLRSLSFEACPKITDFGVIAKLKNLEYLELKGKSELPNLDFIKELPKLKFLILTMNVTDGDVEYLKNIQYVDAVCKRHYNLKSRDLPKDTTDLGFEFI